VGAHEDKDVLPSGKEAFICRCYCLPVCSSVRFHKHKKSAFGFTYAATRKWNLGAVGAAVKM